MRASGNSVTEYERNVATQCKRCGAAQSWRTPLLQKFDCGSSLQHNCDGSWWEYRCKAVTPEPRDE